MKLKIDKILNKVREKDSPAFSGDISGSGTANEIAYFTAEKTIDNLPVATYPSLTELSYVKGVTSAIQTQMGSKVPTSRTITINGTGLDLSEDRSWTISAGGSSFNPILNQVFS